MRKYEYFSEQEKQELEQLFKDGDMVNYNKVFTQCASVPVDWQFLADNSQFGCFYNSGDDDTYYGYLDGYSYGEYLADSGDSYTEFEPLEVTSLDPYKAIQKLQEQQDATKQKDQDQGIILRIPEPDSN